MADVTSRNRACDDVPVSPVTGVRPGRIATAAVDHDHGVTPRELFFDLVFVFAFTQVVRPSPRGEPRTEPLGLLDVFDDVPFLGWLFLAIGGTAGLVAIACRLVF